MALWSAAVSPGICFIPAISPSVVYCAASGGNTPLLSTCIHMLVDITPAAASPRLDLGLNLRLSIALHAVTVSVARVDFMPSLLGPS